MFCCSRYRVPSTALILCALFLIGCARIEIPAAGVSTAATDTADATAAASALHWTLSTEDGVFLGSATAIGPRQLLTNRHVVAAAQGRAIIARQQERRFPIMQVQESRTADLALLALGMAPSVVAGPVAILRRSTPAAGEILAVAGAQSGERRVGTGQALATGAAYGLGLRLARLPAAPGFSGGPVVDLEGRLVGIVMAGASESLAQARRLSAIGAGDPLQQGPVLLVTATMIATEFGRFLANR